MKFPQNEQSGLTHADLMREAPTDIEDQMWATAELTWRETPVGAFARINARREADDSGGDRLAPEVLKAEFPDAPELFTEPMNRRAAQFIYDEHQTRRRLESIVARGPDTNLATAARFGAGLLTHLADPVEMSLNLATLGASSALGISAAATRVAAPMIGARAATIAAPIAVNLGENLAAGVVTEGINYAASRYDAAPYSAQEAMKNIAISTLAFEGAFGAARVAKYGYGKIAGRAARYTEKLSTAYQEAIGKAIRAQLDLGRNPDVGPLIKGFIKETAGDGTHIHRPIVDVADLKQRTFYAASESGGVDYRSGDLAYLGDDFGGAVTLVEDPSAANGAAARELNPADGTIFEARVGELNLIDLDKPLPLEVQSVISQEVKGVNFEGRTGRDVLEALRGREELGDLPEGIVDQVNDALKNKGFHGYLHDGSRMLGEQHPPRNTLVLFDREFAEVGNTRQPDRASVPRLDDAERADAAQRMYGPEADRDGHIAAEAALQENLSNPRTEEITPEDLDKEFEELTKELRDLEKQGGLDAADAKFLENVREFEKKTKRQEEAFRQLSVCYGKAL